MNTEDKTQYLIDVLEGYKADNFLDSFEVPPGVEGAQREYVLTQAKLINQALHKTKDLGLTPLTPAGDLLLGAELVCSTLTRSLQRDLKNSIALLEGSSTTQKEYTLKVKQVFEKSIKLSMNLAHVRILAEVKNLQRVVNEALNNLPSSEDAIM